MKRWVKIKESEQIDKYLDLVRQLQNVWNRKMTVIPVIIGVLGNLKKAWNKTGEIENQRRNCEHPGYSIFFLDRAEYFEESRRTKETLGHADSSERPPAVVDGEKIK